MNDHPWRQVPVTPACSGRNEIHGHGRAQRASSRELNEFELLHACVKKREAHRVAGVTTLLARSAPPTRSRTRVVAVLRNAENPSASAWRPGATPCVRPPVHRHVTVPRAGNDTSRNGPRTPSARADAAGAAPTTSAAVSPIRASVRTDGIRVRLARRSRTFGPRPHRRRAVTLPTLVRSRGFRRLKARRGPEVRRAGCAFVHSAH